MQYIGTILEESLKDNRFLNELEIVSVRISMAEKPEDRWHLYKVKIDETLIESLAHELKPEKWYMHFWNDDDVIVVFPAKTFSFRYSDASSWKHAVDYGKSLGIPEGQLDFIIE